MRLSLRKAASVTSCGTAIRKSGSAPVPRHAGAGGMTNWRAVAHLGVGGGGWTESSNKGPHTHQSAQPRSWLALSHRQAGLRSLVHADASLLFIAVGERGYKDGKHLLPLFAEELGSGGVHGLGV